MLTVKENGLLLSIIKHCEKIIHKTENLNRNQFDNDEDIREIIAFNVLQIGELITHFDNEFLKNHNKIPWAKIRGMRNRIVHGYDTFDLNELWKTGTKDIVPLRNECEEIIKKEAEPLNLWICIYSIGSKIKSSYLANSLNTST